MERTSHDHNFKNLLLDFPKESLNWILPDATKKWGPIWLVEFLRQEPKKDHLKDAHVALDMPILFYFEHKKVILWLVEFQEDKDQFSIHKLGRYTLRLMENYPGTLVIPTVIFTDRKEWRVDVDRQIDMSYNQTNLLHFEYLYIRLFDFYARDYLHVENPVVKILLPKMKYEPHERIEIISQSYLGLFKLVSSSLYNKYIYFIDIYSEIEEDEKQILFNKLQENKETAMLSEYIKDLGRQEGNTLILAHLASKKYHINPENEGLPQKLKLLSSDELLELSGLILEWNTYDKVQSWIDARQKRVT